MADSESVKRIKARYRERHREEIRVRAKEISELKKAGVYVPVSRKLSPEQKAKSIQRRKEYLRERQKNNPDKSKAANDRYNAKHPGIRAEISRRYRQRYPEKAKEDNRANHKEWNKRNKAEVDRRWREWRLLHPRDPERVRQLARETHKRHPESALRRSQRRRARKAGIHGSHTQEEWRALCVRFGNRCVCCGIHGSERKLTKDHIVPITNPLSTDLISNLQPLCQSCNSKKHATHSTDYRATPFTGKGQTVLF